MPTVWFARSMLRNYTPLQSTRGVEAGSSTTVAVRGDARALAVDWKPVCGSERSRRGRASGPPHAIRANARLRPVSRLRT